MRRIRFNLTYLENELIESIYGQSWTIIIPLQQQTVNKQPEVENEFVGTLYLIE